MNGLIMLYDTKEGGGVLNVLKQETIKGVLFQPIIKSCSPTGSVPLEDSHHSHFSQSLSQIIHLLHIASRSDRESNTFLFSDSKALARESVCVCESYSLVNYLDAFVLYSLIDSQKEIIKHKCQQSSGYRTFITPKWVTFIMDRPTR
jgi:hypothetical protein